MNAADLAAFWPAESTDLLLKAIFLPPHEAAAAWRQWETTCRLDEARWADVRLMGAVARRLSELGVESALKGRLAGIRRYFWAHFQTRAHAIHAPLATLGARGIPVLLLKGAATLATAAGTDRFLRDVDFAVPWQRWEEAVGALYDAGWHCTWWRNEAETLAHARETLHAVGFVPDRPVLEADLHHHILAFNRCLGDDAAVWRRAVPARFAELDVLVPCASDRLAIALGHGLFHDPQRPCDWALDAARLILAGGVDWRGFEAEIAARDLHAQAFASLAYLASRLRLPVPPDLLARLEAGTVDPFLAELRALAAGYHPDGRAERRAIRDAAAARADKAAVREGLVAAADRPLVVGPWEAPAYDNGSLFHFTVPPEIAKPGNRVTLGIEIVRDGAGPPLDLSLEALVNFTVELARFDAVARCHRETVAIPPALLAARDIRLLRLKALGPTGDAPAIRRLEYAWRLSPGCA